MLVKFEVVAEVTLNKELGDEEGIKEADLTTEALDLSADSTDAADAEEALAADATEVTERAEAFELSADSKDLTAEIEDTERNEA